MSKLAKEQAVKLLQAIAPYKGESGQPVADDAPMYELRFTIPTSQWNSDPDSAIKAYFTGLAGIDDSVLLQGGYTSAMPMGERQGNNTVISLGISRKMVETDAEMSWEQAQRTKPAAGRPGGKLKIG